MTKRVVRTIVVEGPADAVDAHLNQTWLHPVRHAEFKQTSGVSLKELPWQVTVGEELVDPHLTEPKHQPCELCTRDADPDLTVTLDGVKHTHFCSTACKSVWATPREMP